MHNRAIMLILDFKSRPKKNFLTGLWKGIGAPFMLYGSFTTSIAIPEVDVVTPPSRPSGVRSDWEMIGMDLKTAIMRHEKANSAG